MSILKKENIQNLVNKLQLGKDQCKSYLEKVSKLEYKPNPNPGSDNTISDILNTVKRVEEIDHAIETLNKMIPAAN